MNAVARALRRVRGALGFGARDVRDRRGDVERRRGATWKIAVALVSVTLGAAALGYLSIQLFFLPETVAQSRLNRVPDLTGMELDDAVRSGEEAGYPVIRSGGQYAEDVDAGEVLYQIPPPESYLPKGDTLWVLASLGPSTATMPDLAGVEPEIARAVLSRLGVALTPSRRAASDLHPQGAVIETVPPAGTPIEEDTRVTLVISRGGSFLEMPDVTGLTLAAARDSLESFGLSVGEVTGVQGEQTRGEASVVVVSQDPAAYRRVRAGSAVGLRLGERPREAEAPAAERRAAPDRDQGLVEQPSAAERQRMEAERRDREAPAASPLARDAEPVETPPSRPAPADSTP